MNPKWRVAFLWTGMVLSAVTVTLVLGWNHAQPALAEERSGVAVVPAATRTATPTPTPTPKVATTRQVGWLKSASTAAPTGLQGSFAVYQGAGARPGCSYGLLTSASDVWVSESRYVILNPPEGPAVLQLVFCGDNLDPNARYVLTRPDGRAVDITSSHYNDGPGDGIRYVFPADSPPGTYTLTIRSGSGVVSRTFTAIEYEWRDIALRDATSGKPARTFRRGQDITADYLNFYTGGQVQVGLYHDSAAQGWMLLDTWLIEASSGTTYRERLPIPRDAPLGDYRLVACDLANCSWYLDHKPDGFYVPVIWRAFAITAPARVSLPANTTGLNVFGAAGTNMPKLGVLAAGQPVTVLAGPVSVQGAGWYLVRSDAGSLEGWVHGGYLSMIGP